jgi:hypothetical protein
MLVFWPGIVRAGTDIILLTAAGEAYNGEPSFRLLANNKIVGVGEIPNGFDTATGYGLVSSADFENRIARFVFTVPSLKDVEYLDIEFYNDAWANGGLPGNRSLFVIGVSLSMVDSIQKSLHIETVDFGPTSFKPQNPNQQGVKITEKWAMLANNGRLRLQRPAGGWLPQPLATSMPEKRTTTGILGRQKKKVANAVPANKEEVSVKSKTSNANPEKKRVITGSLPPAKKKKLASDTPATAEQLTTSKSKTSAATAPAENTAAEPENPATEVEGQAKPPNYSRYALPKERCRRIGEKGTDRLC